MVFFGFVFVLAVSSILAQSSDENLLGRQKQYYQQATIQTHIKNFVLASTYNCSDNLGYI
jgi:hypothetical protein